MTKSGGVRFVIRELDPSSRHAHGYDTQTAQLRRFTPLSCRFTPLSCRFTPVPPSLHTPRLLLFTHLHSRLQLTAEPDAGLIHTMTITLSRFERLVQTGPLNTIYNGSRPSVTCKQGGTVVPCDPAVHGYNPMKLQGAIIMGKVLESVHSTQMLTALQIMW